MENKSIHRLYSIEFPNGKFYFGSTKFLIHRRMRNHAYSARSGSTLKVHQAIRQFGIENCRMSTLVLGDEKYIKQIEENAILFFMSLFPFGYNSYIGSKLSPSHTRSGENNGMYGRKHSDETKEKIRQKALSR